MRQRVMTILVLLVITVIFTGCSKGTVATLTSSASFDPKANVGLKGTVLPAGAYDKAVLVEGHPTSDFRIIVGVSVSQDTASTSSLADILFAVKDGKISPLGDWEMAGGGERPALRRENDKELTIYYPADLKGQRTWVRFQVTLKE